MRVKDAKILLEEYKKYDYLNNRAENLLIKIFVSYIKPSFLFKSKILFPIHPGRAVEREKSKSGEVFEEDISWLHKNCIGDDDFAGNISSVNRRVGFLTGTYYARKNYEKIGNPQYFGSFGYRRLLTPSFLDFLGGYEAVFPVEKSLFPETIKEQFIRIHGNLSYKNMIEVFYNTYPQEISELIKYFERSSGFFDEIYVMRKDVFFEFCDWIFPLLFEYLKLETDSSSAETRDVAFIMERLTGYYLFKLKNNRFFKYCESEVIITQKGSVNKNMINKNLLDKLRNRIKEVV